MNLSARKQEPIARSMHEGERIRRIRDSLSLPQKYVAAELGVSTSTMSRIEDGSVALRYRTAVQLARIFNCDLGAFDESLGGPLRPVVPPAIRS